MNIETMTDSELKRHFVASNDNETNLIDRIDCLAIAQKKIQLAFEDLDQIEADKIDQSFDECTDRAVESGVITDLDEFIDIFKPYIEAFTALEKNITDQDEQIAELEEVIDNGS